MSDAALPNMADLFVRDEMEQSAENRLNFLLLGLFLSDAFRTSVLESLKLAADLLFYKPANVQEGLRPDFAAWDPSRQQTVAYVEVELGRDPEQKARYQAATGLRVFSFGQGEGHELTWDALLNLAKKSAKSEDSPQLELFTLHLQRLLQGNPGYSPPGPVTNQLETPLGQRLVQEGMKNLGAQRLAPGDLYCHAYGPEGMSVRVYSRKAVGRTVGVFNIQAGSRDAHFASRERLCRYLPDQLEEIERWCDFVEEILGAPVRRVALPEYCTVSLSVVENHLEELTRALLLLKG